MGTRSYAYEVAKVLDPNKKIGFYHETIVALLVLKFSEYLGRIFTKILEKTGTLSFLLFSFIWDAGLKHNHSVRPEWKPTILRVSLVTGKTELHEPFRSRMKRHLIVDFLLFLAALVVVGYIIGVIVLQHVFYDSFKAEWIDSVGDVLAGFNRANVASTAASLIFTVF
jgi:hypothetical protein